MIGPGTISVKLFVHFTFVTVLCDVSMFKNILYFQSLQGSDQLIFNIDLPKSLN